VILVVGVILIIHGFSGKGGGSGGLPPNGSGSGTTDKPQNGAEPVTLAELQSGEWEQQHLKGQQSMRFNTNGTLSTFFGGSKAPINTVTNAYTYNGNVLTVIGNPALNGQLTWATRPNRILFKSPTGEVIFERVP
jgi:hypothetical protein